MKKGTVIVGFILSFISGMMLMWGVDRGKGVSATKDQAAAVVEGARKVNPGAPKVELYIMQQCPYGVQAENGFKDVVDKLGADVDIRLEFIGDKSPQGDLTSMHGPGEVKGDLVHICSMKYSPKWFDFVLCTNKNAREAPNTWEACAKESGVPVDKVKACVEGEEGKKLLSDSFQRAKDKGARGSPTIYIGGQQYQGGRRAPDYFKAVCAAFTGKKPEACSNIPESPKVNVTLLSDKRCAECDTKRFEGMIRQRVANPVLTSLDYADAQGKAMFEKIKPAQLPVAVFDATLDADKEAATVFARNQRVVGDLKVVAMGGSWNPACADEGGCDKDDCKNTLQCRKEEPNKLEIFAMSQCPFGVKGFDAMQEVLKNFNNEIDFSIHYIGNGDAAKGLTSMHGQGEVDEDIRQLCAIKKYPKKYKFMEYIWCRDKNIKDTNWESCASEKSGFDAKALKKCFEGEDGKKLLEASFKYSAESGMSSSPSWLVNGKYKFSGIDAETIKTNFCAHNKIKGCENKLSGPPAAPAGGPAPQPGGCGG